MDAGLARWWPLWLQEAQLQRPCPLPLPLFPPEDEKSLPRLSAPESSSSSMYDLQNLTLKYCSLFLHLS